MQPGLPHQAVDLQQVDQGPVKQQKSHVPDQQSHGGQHKGRKNISAMRVSASQFMPMGLSGM